VSCPTTKLCVAGDETGAILTGTSDRAKGVADAPSDTISADMATQLAKGRGPVPGAQVMTVAILRRCGMETGCMVDG
jgi:hypothetical protein